MEMQDKMRIVQELVPGKQVTLAHVIANPDPVLYEKLGLDPAETYNAAAIGILTISLGFMMGNKAEERFRYAYTNLLIG